MGVLGTFQLKIMDVDCVIYQNDVSNLFAAADHWGEPWEFELLAFHYPVICVLCPGDIVIDWREVVTIKKGILKFFKNECTVLVELP